MCTSSPIIPLHSINKVLTGKAENRLELIIFFLEINKIPTKQDSAVRLCVCVYKPMLYLTNHANLLHDNFIICVTYSLHIYVHRLICLNALLRLERLFTWCFASHIPPSVILTWRQWRSYTRAFAQASLHFAQASNNVVHFGTSKNTAFYNIKMLPIPPTHTRYC